MPHDPATPPTLDCRPLPAFAAADLEAVRAAFRDATPIVLGQAWLGTTEPDFAPGIVHTGWCADALLVFAELGDADIFTHALRPNERFWELGDTFEMFLQPRAAPAYVEFHVAPNNLRLQLRFATPSTPAPRTPSDPLEVVLMRDDAFQSHTWVDAAAREWCVLAEIPAASVTGPEGGPSGAEPSPLAGSRWRFSFSRYDYTRGRAQPVISSSSPHTEPRFHRPHEWGTLRFRE